MVPGSLLLRHNLQGEDLSASAVVTRDGWQPHHCGWPLTLLHLSEQKEAPHPRSLGH